MKQLYVEVRVEVRRNVRRLTAVLEGDAPRPACVLTIRSGAYSASQEARSTDTTSEGGSDVPKRDSEQPKEC